MRIRSGEVEYRAKWRGWPSSTNTWEPKAHLTEYGASDSVAAWHALNPDRPDPSGVGHQGPGMITGLGTTLAPNFVIGPSYGELYCGSFGVLQSKF